MNYSYIILIATGLLMYNIYTDNQFFKKMKQRIKYIKMIGIGFIGLSFYLFIKKHPNDSKSWALHASNLVKYAPIDKNSKDFISPIIDLSKQSHLQSSNLSSNKISNNNSHSLFFNHSQHKRSVSESRKKYVASMQNWKCKDCQNTLDATYEVNHIIELQDGGSNEISNLEALCRNCHGKKTMLRKL